ncbi:MULTISPECIES: NPP1 family protein [Streptomyces]|uniref:NPP1 family protein n=1 Tax=Streptomyces TaxID=1883 RepID=UPI000BF0F6E1|nr:NPP1 family protein [Streptomyces sp. wa1063]WTE26855.1 NPP1 family protein [Streptomyces anulatus]
MRTPPIPATPAGNRSAAPAGASIPLPIRNRLAAGTGTAKRATRTATVLAAAGILVLGAASTAHADPPGNLPQNAGGYEQAFSPAFDYDGDGCYATPAIGPDGALAPGLKTTGAINGSCRDQWDLDNSQTYARSKCNNGWCGIVYASYFEKDQAVHGSGLGGHRHDFEHVISWVNQGSGQVDHVSTTQHSTVKTYPRSQVRFDGSHPKAVYHKDGPSTHFFRLANGNDEPPENHYGNWRYPPVVDWNGFPSTELRDRLMNADFGSATIKVTDRDDRFRNLLNNSKPAGIPFDPWA